MSLNTAPRTWVVGEVVTASELNTEIRDAITGIQAAWTGYTPALTAPTTSPTLSTGSSITGSFGRYGKTIMGWIDVNYGTAGFSPGSGVYEISIPVAAGATPASIGAVIGHGLYIDASPLNVTQVELRLQTTTTARMLYTGGTSGLSSAAPVVPAVNDQLHLDFFYPAA